MGGHCRHISGVSLGTQTENKRVTRMLEKKRSQILGELISTSQQLEN